MFFKDWINGGILYIKCRYNNNSTFKNINYPKDAIKSKRNWLCEYTQLKKSTRAVNSKFNFENIECVNIKDTQELSSKTRHVRLSIINCRSRYDNLLSMKL